MIVHSDIMWYIYICIYYAVLRTSTTFFHCFHHIPGYSSAMNLEKSFRQCCCVWFVRFGRPKHVCFGSSQGGCVDFFGIILTPTLVLFRWGPRSLGAAWAIMQVKPGLLHWIYWLICSPDRLPGWVCTFETALVLGWWIKRWWLFEIMSMSLTQFRKCFDQNWLYFTAVFISGLLLFSDLHLGILSIVKVSDLIR